jgi:hypothetical protein
MFVEYNRVSLIAKNYKNSPMNILLILPNGKMLDFIFCSFNTSKKPHFLNQKFSTTQHLQLCCN